MTTKVFLFTVVAVILGVLVWGFAKQYIPASIGGAKA